VEVYYDRFLRLCAIILQQLDDISLKKVFQKCLRTKVKMVIINMPKRTLTELVEFAIIIKEKLPMKWKNMARYHQNVFDSYDSDEYDDFDNEDEHHEKKTKKKFYRICKTSAHNTYQCPSKAMSGSCPLKKIIPIHVV